MPQFRIHNPRNRSDRVLIRLVQGRNVLTTQIPASVSQNQPQPIITTSAPSVAPVPVQKPKKKISMRHIQEIIKLLQNSKSKNKNLSKLLTANLAGLLSQDDEVDVDEVDEDSEVEIEEVDGDEGVSEDDEDVLIIDL